MDIKEREACHAGRDRHEEGTLPLFSRAEMSQRRRIIALQKKIDDNAQRNQYHFHDQNEFAVQSQCAPAMVPQKIIQRDEAYASQKHRDTDQRIGCHSGESDIISHDIHTAIREGRDRMPVALINADPSILCEEISRKDGTGTKFYRERHQDDLSHQHHHTRRCLQIEGIPDKEPLLQADLPPPRDADHGHHRHDPQTAHLHQKKYDQLPEDGKVSLQIKHAHPRHADDTDRHEERIQEGDFLRSCLRDGQHEEERPKQHEGCKTTTDEDASMKLAQRVK